MSFIRFPPLMPYPKLRLASQFLAGTAAQVYLTILSSIGLNLFRQAQPLLAQVKELQKNVTVKPEISLKLSARAMNETDTTATTTPIKVALDLGILDIAIPIVIVVLATIVNTVLTNIFPTFIIRDSVKPGTWYGKLLFAKPVPPNTEPPSSRSLKSQTISLAVTLVFAFAGLVASTIVVTTHSAKINVVVNDNDVSALIRVGSKVVFPDGLKYSGIPHLLIVAVLAWIQIPFLAFATIVSAMALRRKQQLTTEQAPRDMRNLIVGEPNQAPRDMTNLFPTEPTSRAPRDMENLFPVEPDDDKSFYNVGEKVEPRVGPLGPNRV